MGQNWYFVNILEQNIEFEKCLVFKKISSQTEENNTSTGILLKEIIQSGYLLTKIIKP